MIELKGIDKTFNRNSSNEIHLIKNLDLTFNNNDFTLIIGSNGSGKSTLLNLIAGTFQPDKGNIFFDKINITSYKDHQRSKWMARIFQDPLAGTSPELSLLENFRLASLRTQKKGLSIGTTSQFRKKVSETLAQLELGLEDKLEQRMGTLSGGQRQAMTLLMATSDETRLLLLDEPVAALDPKTARTIMQLADKLIREKSLTAIMVTHSMKDVMEYGNRLIMLKTGKVDSDLNSDEKKSIGLDQLYSWYGN